MIVSALALNPMVAAQVQRLFSIPTIALRDVALMAAGAGALALYAISGAVAAGFAACAILAAIALYSGIGAVTSGGWKLVLSSGTLHQPRGELG
jgi:hypothetical protein